MLNLTLLLTSVHVPSKIMATKEKASYLARSHRAS